MRRGFMKLPVFGFHGIFEIPWRLSAIFKNRIGIPVAGSSLVSLIWDTVREMAVAGYEAASAEAYSHPTRYPLREDLDLA